MAKHVVFLVIGEMFKSVLIIYNFLESIIIFGTPKVKSMPFFSRFFKVFKMENFCYLFRRKILQIKYHQCLIFNRCYAQN